MNILFILNDSPYGIERTYNGLRLAMSISKKPDVEVTVNLVGDAVQCARKGQKTPDGFYNIERMIQSIARKGMVAT